MGLLEVGTTEYWACGALLSRLFCCVAERFCSLSNRCIRQGSAIKYMFMLLVSWKNCAEVIMVIIIILLIIMGNLWRPIS